MGSAKSARPWVFKHVVVASTTIANMMAINTDELLSNMGAKAKRLRLHSNLTRDELARKSGVPYSTLRRLETKGEGSMRDYIRVFQALKRMDELTTLADPAALSQERVRARASRKTGDRPVGDATVLIGDYPQLQSVAWNRRENATCSEIEALALYERNWRFVDHEALSPKERAFIERLVAVHGNGVLHV